MVDVFEKLFKSDITHNEFINNLRLIKYPSDYKLGIMNAAVTREAFDPTILSDKKQTHNKNTRAKFKELIAKIREFRKLLANVGYFKRRKKTEK